jgi:dUTP pyrophosphatase
MNLKFKRLHERAKLPTRSHPGDAAVDLYAVDYAWEHNTQTYSYRTGVAVEIPPGYVGLLFMRSSAVCLDAVMKNAVGVIDSGYRGELTVKLMPTATDHASRFPQVGDRIAQLVVVPFLELNTEFVDELSPSSRGTNGYGSTGR